jgi:hypothetical protein
VFVAWGVLLGCVGLGRVGIVEKIMGGRLIEGVNDREAVFIAEYAAGKTKTDAARLAGYANYEQEGARLLKRPAVRAELAKVRAELISGDGARLAWATMEALMQDSLTPSAVRFNAARWTLEAAGLGLAARIADNTGAPEKALAELSLGELEAFITKGREALAELREVHPVRVVDVESVSVGVGAGEGVPV